MKLIRTPIAEISFNETESILNIKILEGAEMSLKKAQEHYGKINDLVGNKKYVALVDAANYYPIEREAWQYASLEKVISNRKAVAHYNSSFANRLTTTFFNALYGTSMPIEIFRTKEEAMEWLKSFS